MAVNENHHVATGARGDDGISVFASSVTISPFMKLITMASIPSLSDPSPPLDLTPASRYSKGKYYDSKEEQNNDHDIDDYDCDSDTNNDNDDEEPEQEQAPPEVKATYSERK